MKAYDIDWPDAHNELAVVEYVEDIYRFYKSTEVILFLLFFALYTHSLLYKETVNNIDFFTAFLIDLAIDMSTCDHC